MALLDFLPAAGSFITGLFGMGAQSQANTANMELAKYQFEKNKEMWNEQNRYNSPEQQMARLKAAGLNPNLVYGSGAVGNTTGSAPTMERPTMQRLTDGGFVSDAVQRGLFTQAQLENLKNSNELVKTQQKVQEANIARIAQETAESLQRTAKSKFDLDLARELRNNSVEVSNENLRKIQLTNQWREINNAMDNIRLEMMPLEKQLKSSQIANLNASVQNLLWDLEMKQTGLIPGNDALSWLANQGIRYMKGLPSVFDGIGVNKMDLETVVQGYQMLPKKPTSKYYDKDNNIIVPKGGV